MIRAFIGQWVVDKENLNLLQYSLLWKRILNGTFKHFVHTEADSINIKIDL